MTELSGLLPLGLVLSCLVQFIFPRNDKMQRRPFLVKCQFRHSSATYDIVLAP